MNPASDFSTVASAIRFLREHFREQPALDEVAAAVGLSPFHFQRLFSRWAGVSPKRFLQFLTVEEAKLRLRRSVPVLEAAFQAGLSGPARLHDLLVTTTAVTPGEYKSYGAALEIRHGVAETPFGPALFGATDRGLCHLAFLDETDPHGESELEVLRKGWPLATLLEDPASAAGLSRTIFSASFSSSHPPDRPLPLLLKGTNFQIRVWEALLRVPPGAVTTYGRLARALGRPGSARAVGGAVGRNSMAYLIPCHRVIREEGTPGGYRWGQARKSALLGWEAARETARDAGSTPPEPLQ